MVPVGMAALRARACSVDLHRLGGWFAWVLAQARSLSGASKNRTVLSRMHPSRGAKFLFNDDAAIKVSVLRAQVGPGSALEDVR